MPPRDPEIFVLIVAGTVALTRILLHAASLLQERIQWKFIPKPTVFGFRIHHYHYGFLLCLVGVGIGNLSIVAVGIGLIVDEVWFILALGGDDHKYLSASSILGALTGILVMLLARNQIHALILGIFDPISRAIGRH